MIDRAAEFRRLAARHWDEAVVLGTFAKLAFERSASLDAGDAVVIEALRRSSPDLAEASKTELGDYLADMDEDAVAGVVSNVKGIAHELTFVEIENTDGDSVEAILFPDTNHPGTDVLLHDTATGEVWEVQLKASDSEAYVQDWIEAHPDGEIMVTEELADAMDLPSTGLENGVLTADVERVVDRLANDESLWDQLPLMSTLTLAPVIYALCRRHARGELDRAELLQMIARATGWKLAKVTALTAAMSIPGLNVAVGAVIVARMLMSGGALARRLG